MVYADVSIFNDLVSVLKLRNLLLNLKHSGVVGWNGLKLLVDELMAGLALDYFLAHDCKVFPRTRRLY